MEKPILQVKSIEKNVDDTSVTLKVSIYNPEDRTVFAYSCIRRIQYNNSTKVLTVSLHDNHIKEDSLISNKLKEPKFLELESKATTVLTLKLQKTIKRLKSANESKGSSEKIEVLNIAEAEEVVVEIGQHDVPFYYNPKQNNAAQLKNWGKKVSIFPQKFKPIGNSKK